MTNEIIVGEVEFYLVDHTSIAASVEKLSLGVNTEVSAFDPQSKVMMTAKFFGSDFNYANSKEFRRKFATHTQDFELINIGL